MERSSCIERLIKNRAGTHPDLNDDFTRENSPARAPVLNLLLFQGTQLIANVTYREHLPLRIDILAALERQENGTARSEGSIVDESCRKYGQDWPGGTFLPAGFFDRTRVIAGFSVSSTDPSSALFQP